MATIIYKQDENGNTIQERCEAKMLQGKLAQGYVTDPGDFKEVEVEEEDKWKGYSNDDIRALAKEAGIDNYAKARIEPLKAALDAQE